MSTDAPDGTAQDVLDWVDDDPGRAQAAIRAEHARPSPRTTLIAKLEPIAAKAAQEDPMADEPATQEAEPEQEEIEEAPGPQPPAGDDLSVDLADRATYIGPVNVRDSDVEKPDDSFDLVAAEARAADPVEEAPVDATSVEVFQIASSGAAVVLNFDGTSVLLDANQAAALSKDLKSALAGVTY